MGFNNGFTAAIRASLKIGKGRRLAVVESDDGLGCRGEGMGCSEREVFPHLLAAQCPGTVLKGVEFHNGKPIFYSLGNFAIEQPHTWDPAITKSASFKNLVSLNPSWNLDQLYTLPPVTRLSGIAKITRLPDGGCQTRFLPVWIGDDSAPRVLSAADPHFAEVEEFLLASSRDAGLNLGITRDGDELLLHSA